METPVQGQAKGQRSVAVKISGGGGGGILLLGGSLVVAAVGAALAFHRSRAKKRTSPPTLPEEEEEKQRLILLTPVHFEEAEESGCEDEKIDQAKMGLQSLIPLVEEEEIPADHPVDVVSEQAPMVSKKIDIESKVIVEELELNRVQEVKEEEEEELKEGEESPSIGSQEEETESSVEDDGDGGEEGSDGTGSSTRESSVGAVWPAEVIEQEKEMKSSAIESNTTQVDVSEAKPKDDINHSEFKLNETVELLEISKTVKSLINTTQVVDVDVDVEEEEEDDDDEEEEDYDDEELLLNAQKKEEAAEITESGSMAMKSEVDFFTKTHPKVILLLVVLLLALGLVSMEQIFHGLLP